MSQASAEEVDTAFADLLLAESEKQLAVERYEFTRLICTNEFRHYMATIGNDAVVELSERCHNRELDLQREFDDVVLNAATREFPANARQMLHDLDNFASQKLAWRYMTSSKAIAALEEETARQKGENQKKAKEVEAKLKQQKK